MPTFGPSGGRGAGDSKQFFEINPPGSEVGVLVIKHGAVIDSIQVLWRPAAAGGQFILGPQIGGNGGQLSIVPLNVGEHITEISGRTGAYVDSLTIVTNQGRRFGRFGGLGGSEDYDFPGTPGQGPVIGFFGAVGLQPNEYVFAIGIVTS
jgi:Jacalin-like lectin domain